MADKGGFLFGEPSSCRLAHYTDSEGLARLTGRFVQAIGPHQRTGNLV